MTKSKKVTFISAEEFLSRQVPCRNGNKCDRADCKFMHNVKVKLCRFGKRCRRRDKCPCAHDDSELYVPMCKFGLYCKNSQCTFDHPKKNFWDVTEEPKADSNVLAAEAFPETIRAEAMEPVEDYSELKNLRRVESETISGTADQISDAYSNIISFKSLSLRLE